MQIAPGMRGKVQPLAGILIPEPELSTGWAHIKRKRGREGEGKRGEMKEGEDEKEKKREREKGKGRRREGECGREKAKGR